MVKLPTEIIKAERTNPKKLIMFSQAKTGKTESLSRLKDNLLIDLEDGSQFVDGLKINVLQENYKYNKENKENQTPLKTLRMIIDSLKESNSKKGDYTYKFITLDTVSALEDIYGIELAAILYKATSQGKNWDGTDVRKLPNGNGYLYLREAVIMILNEFEDLCDTLIVTGHLKEKLVDKNGSEMVSSGIDLSGKLGSIICSQADAICYLYRKDNQTIANFKPSEALAVGARPQHLKNVEIVLLESDDKGNFKDHWDKIFI